MRRKLQETTPVSYWKSMVDAITTLMMIVLLVLMFIILSFFDLQDRMDDDLGDTFDHNAYNDHVGDEELTPTPTISITPTPSITPAEDHDGGGGGGGADPTPIPSPVPTVMEGDEGAYERAAVYAVLVDEETGLIIEAPEIVFELYNTTDVRQTLDTHYPERITFTEYETTEHGDFYLPDKIAYGTYYLRQMTQVEGYDFSGDTYFEVDDTRDWDDPIIVQIPLGPSRNNIQIQINDGVTMSGLSGVIFDVVSDGDNITPDGTVRYSNGEIVDTIECDDTGYGLSHALYIGNFRLVPRNLPYGYAAPDLSTREIELNRRSSGGEYAPLIVLSSFKTSVNINVVDELNPGTFVEGATFTLTAEGEEARSFTTNRAGHITIEDLSKNTNYRLMLTGTAAGYLLEECVYDFTVDSLGNIDNSSNYIIETSNRMLRVSVSTVDKITRMQLTGVNISLLDSNGNVVETWESNGTAHNVDGLEPGLYTVKVDGNDSKITIKVENISEIQKFSNSIMTNMSYVVLGSIVFLILVGIGVAIVRVRSWRRKKKVVKGND